MTTKALITGIVGQDGSYLTELLLDKGYEVHGIVRRSSLEPSNLQRVAHLLDKITLHEGDLLDQSSLMRIVQDVKPEEVYHLGAMSHVGTSFKEPIHTASVTGLGTLRMLEACRALNPMPKFYFAGSSEMFGDVAEEPQSETTELRARSPYGAAKVFGYHSVKVYREAYGMHASVGILFNHECISEKTPMIVRRRGKFVDVCYPADLMPLRRKGRCIQQSTVNDIEIWSGCDWSQLTAITATHRRRADPEHNMIRTQVRAGVVETTAHHTLLRPDLRRVKAGSVQPGSTLLINKSWPKVPNITFVSEHMAEFLGLMCARGYINERGSARFTKNNDILRARVASLWERLFAGKAREDVGVSGFTGGPVKRIEMHGAASAGRWLRAILYTKDKEKRVPLIVLNAGTEAITAFLKGHYAGDGLKEGNGDSFSSSDPSLAQGLVWLYAACGRTAVVYSQKTPLHTRPRYLVNLRSSRCGAQGRHLRKSLDEVRRVEPGEESAWVFDIETRGGKFNAGVGAVVVKNSPRRGLNFVTRKITRHVARQALGLTTDPLELGNLDSRRDWGHARDFVYGQWLMLQQPEPGDYVLATGETHSVREFVEAAYGAAGCKLDWFHAGTDEVAKTYINKVYRQVVQVNPKFYRPADVHTLTGDASKAKRVLGWQPRTTFKDLVRTMVESDLEALRK